MPAISLTRCVAEDKKMPETCKLVAKLFTELQIKFYFVMALLKSEMSSLLLGDTMKIAGQMLSCVLCMRQTVW